MAKMLNWSKIKTKILNETIQNLERSCRTREFFNL